MRAHCCLFHTIFFLHNNQFLYAWIKQNKRLDLMVGKHLVSGIFFASCSYNTIMNGFIAEHCMVHQENNDNVKHNSWTHMRLIRLETIFVNRIDNKILSIESENGIPWTSQQFQINICSSNFHKLIIIYLKNSLEKWAYSVQYAVLEHLSISPRRLLMKRCRFDNIYWPIHANYLCS